MAEIVTFSKSIKRYAPLRKVGLDTDICLCWMDEENYTDYQPKICKGSTLFINYKVFSELMGLKRSSFKTEDDTRKEIFDFLRRHKITLLKKSEIDNIKVQQSYEELKRQNFKGMPGNEDLEIIAIFKAAGIDCIFSNNARHFEEPCNYLKISFERPFMIKVGSNIDVNNMLKRLYRFKKKKY